MTPFDQAILEQLALEELPGGSGGLTVSQLYLRFNHKFGINTVTDAAIRLEKAGKVWTYTAKTRFAGWQVFYFVPTPEAVARENRKRA